MEKIIIDSDLHMRLRGLDSRMELCDEAGQTVGFFVPVNERQRLLYSWAKNEFTDEEIDRARQQPGGYTLKEVLADLSGE